MQIQLQTLLEYKNNHLTNRYQAEYPDSEMCANTALTELMKYIWLCHKHTEDKQLSPNNSSLDFPCVIHREMKDIDNMWHTFLLFTRDYQQFCNDYLHGCFFHHDPFSPSDEVISDEVYTVELERYLSYIHDNLGEETLRRWFSETDYSISEL